MAATAGIVTTLVFTSGDEEQGLVETAGAVEDTADAATGEEREFDEPDPPQEAEFAEVEPDETESDSEPAPAPEAVDLRQRNWARHPWPTNCNALYEDIEATLGPSDFSDLPGVLEFASSAGQVSTVVFSVWVDDAVFGDLTGDGHDEAVFETSCFHGNWSEQMLEVWSLDDQGQPYLLPMVHSWTKLTGILQSFTVQDGALRVETAEGVPGDDAPHINGYPVDVVTEWRFYGGSWSATEIARSEPPLRTACISPNSTPQAAAECLVEAVTEGDHGAALLVADVMVVRALIDAHEAGHLERWEFFGCGEPGMLRPESNVACGFFSPPPEGVEEGGYGVEIAVESTSRGWFLTEIDYLG